MQSAEPVEEPPVPAAPPRLVLRFSATQCEPDYTEMFMETGGSINSAATFDSTDVAVTGSAHSTVLPLGKAVCEAEVELPASQYKLTEEGKFPAIEMPSDTRLNLSTSRVGPAINGTLVSSVSGQGSDHLHRILNADHSQTGLAYSTWGAYAATFGISNARVVRVDGGTETPVRVDFVARPKEDTERLARADALVNEYAENAWTARQSLVYAPSPMLTKSVFREPVGVDGQGYSLVHDIVERDPPMGLAALDSLFHAALMADLGQSKSDFDTFMAATASPGITAASHARTVAGAASLLANYLVSYRADGRNTVSAKGTDFSAAESWLRQVQRTPIEANDCDGSALLAIGAVKAAQCLAAEQEATHRHLAAVRNVVFPYYQLGLSVVGASAAEATSADASHSTVAGHAITVLLPTISILRALARSADAGSEEQLAQEAQMRFEALFSEADRERLTPSERDMLASWAIAKHEFTERFEAFAIEGTTPSTPTLFMRNDERRANAAREAKLDDAALKKASPNVFRSTKSMHVGGVGDGHRFYRDLVEVTFARSSPLWKSPALRAGGLAATQFVLTKTNGEVGASPKEIALEEYGMTPLVSVATDAAEDLDFASEVAARDVVPPRPRGPMKLSKFQSNSLKTSMTHLERLGAEWSKRETRGADGAASVQYIAAFSTLVNNPNGVGHFCGKMKELAPQGVVDMVKVDSMAVDSDGKQAGVFVCVEACIA